MKLPQPLHVFRIYPGYKHGKYYQVQVFRTLRDLREFCVLNCQVYSRRSMNGAYGVCHHFTKEHYTRDKRRVVDPWTGQIHFAARSCGITTVAHECTHAALYVVHAGKSVLKFNDLDEPLARMVGILTRQCVDKLYELGVWK